MVCIHINTKEANRLQNIIWIRKLGDGGALSKQDDQRRNNNYKTDAWELWTIKTTENLTVIFKRLCNIYLTKYLLLHRFLYPYRCHAVKCWYKSVYDTNTLYNLILSISSLLVQYNNIWHCMVWSISSVTMQLRCVQFQVASSSYIKHCVNSRWDELFYISPPPAASSSYIKNSGNWRLQTPRPRQPARGRRTHKPSDKTYVQLATEKQRFVIMIYNYMRSIKCKI